MKVTEISKAQEWHKIRGITQRKTSSSEKNTEAVLETGKN